MSPSTKAIKAHVCLSKHPKTFPMELKIGPPMLSTVASNASAVYPAIFLRACVSLFSHFFEISLHFLVTQKQYGILLLQDACNSKRNCCGSQRKGINY